METKRNMHNFVPNELTNFQRGIDFQREVFKQANLENNYETMVKALENIKSEIRTKTIAQGNEDKIERIEIIIQWYKTLPLRYRKRTEEGIIVVYPIDVNIKISKYLNKAYEIIVDQLVKLKLI